MNPSQLRHSDGPTFNGISSWVGLALVVVAVIIFIKIQGKPGFAFSVIPGVLGIILFLSIRGVIIDFEKKTLTRYTDLILFKIPLARFDISGCQLIELRLFSHFENRGLRAASTTTHTKVFEIYLIDPGDESRVLVADSPNRASMKNIMLQISKSLNIPAYDRYEEHRQRKT